MVVCPFVRRYARTLYPIVSWGEDLSRGCLATERLLRRQLSARVVDGVIRSAGAGQNELADRDDLIAFAQQIF